MSLSPRKIGFWSVFELVTISQIGSGLMLPAQLATFGSLSLVGWGISGLGALILAVVFAELCTRNPKMGGPHVYIRGAFGPTAAFFTGWTYWIISWISTVAIITSAVGYLSPLLNENDTSITLGLEISIITWATFINLKGHKCASKKKFWAVMVKLFPLILVPIAALFFFDITNFTTPNTLTVAANFDEISPLNKVVLITLWGFIGFESATATADKIAHPSKTIRYAILLGTLFVAAIYFISTLGIMGMIPGQTLIHSKAPYADAAFVMGGMTGYIIISIVCTFICLGAVTAWTRASGHIALGLTQDNLMPKLFAKTNKNNAPIAALLISWIGTVSMLVLIHKESLAQQINMIIDLSVITFLFVYAICCLAYLKILYFSRTKTLWWQWLAGLSALVFCSWIIFSTNPNTLLIASLFTLSGMPAFLIQIKKIVKSNLPNPA